MGGGIGWLLLGLVLGVGGPFLFIARKSDQRVAEIEERYAGQLRQAQDEALQADMAHAETKERLIDLQMRHRDLEKRLKREEDLKAGAERLAAATAEGDGEAKGGRANSTRLKAIEAKLAQLPAGSSARARLERQRVRLLRHS